MNGVATFWIKFVNLNIGSAVAGSAGPVLPPLYGHSESDNQSRFIDHIHNGSQSTREHFVQFSNLSELTSGHR